MQKLIYLAFISTLSTVALSSGKEQSASAAKPAAKEPATKESATKVPAERSGGKKAKSSEKNDPTQNEYLLTDHYTHKWIRMPSLSGQAVNSQSTIDFAPERGTVNVVVFLASWCIPCQQIIMKVKDIEKAFENRHTRVLYVFTHDTRNDAKGFSKLYDLRDNTMVANGKILEDFHQPELPTIYVSDRTEWLAMRLKNTDHEALKKLEAFLAIHTSY